VIELEDDDQAKVCELVISVGELGNSLRQNSGEEDGEPLSLVQR